MANGEKKQTVLVTGGSGYVAGWIVVGLLREGYTVRATLRSLKREESVRAAVMGQVNATGRLSFVAADLLSDEGWDHAVSGCDYVLHVASPMGQGEPKGTDLVSPARDGTLRVLKAAAKNGVHRVVYTSSLSAAQAQSVPGETQPRTDERTWTKLEEKGLSEYGRSKTLAERAAWDFVEHDTSGMTLATVLPGVILGPVMTDSISGSVEVISRFLSGRVPANPRIGFSITDIRDLVDLHMKAMTSPEAANQRFVGVGDFLWMADMARILKERFGAVATKVPTRRLPNLVVRLAAPFQEEARFMAPMLGKRRVFNASKADNLLHWHPRPSSDSVIDCAESLIQRKLV